MFASLLVGFALRMFVWFYLVFVFWLLLGVLLLVVCDCGWFVAFVCWFGVDVFCFVFLLLLGLFCVGLMGVLVFCVFVVCCSFVLFLLLGWGWGWWWLGLGLFGGFLFCF